MQYHFWPRLILIEQYLQNKKIPMEHPYRYEASLLWNNSPESSDIGRGCGTARVLQADPAHNMYIINPIFPNPGRIKPGIFEDILPKKFLIQ